MPRVVLLAVCAVALAGCGGSGGNGNDGAGGIPTLSITLMDAGCSPREATAKAGPLTIAVTNGGTSDVTRLELRTPDGIILGERENVTAGISGGFTLNLEPGRYTLDCPNAAQPHGTLTVTGNASAAAHGPDALKLALATAGYK